MTEECSCGKMFKKIENLDGHIRRKDKLLGQQGFHRIEKIRRIFYMQEIPRGFLSGWSLCGGLEGTGRRGADYNEDT